MKTSSSKIISLFKKKSWKRTSFKFEGGRLNETDLNVGMEAKGNIFPMPENEIELYDLEIELLETHIRFEVLDKYYSGWDSGISPSGTTGIVELVYNKHFRRMNYNVTFTEIKCITTMKCHS